MKICDATQFYSPVSGGVRRYITEKRRYVQTRTEDEHLLIVPGGKNETVRSGRLTTCVVASPVVHKDSQYRILLNLGQVSRFIEAEKPDIIESGDPYQLGWHLAKLGRRLNIPVVGFYHSHFPEAYVRTAAKYGGVWVRDRVMDLAKRYVVKLYNRFDRTLVPSLFLADVLTEWGVRNTISVRLGVDTEMFAPGESKTVSREGMHIPEDTFLLLYTGRLSGDKNTFLLLDTFELLENRFPGKFSFLIIGDGQLRESVILARKKLPHLRWIPYCGDPRQLADYYRLADLFVHPGVHETFGLVALESQACGCPVAGIRGSYMDANIFAGHQFWAKENTPEALADAILEFTKQDLKQLGQSARQAAVEKFSWPRNFRKYWRYYQEMIEEKRG